MRIFLSFFGKDWHEPTTERWKAFAAAIMAAGHELLDSSNLESADFGIWVDDDPATSTRTNLPRQNMVLVQIEPKSVNPKQYSKKVESKFGYIFCEDINRPGGKIYWQSGQFSAKDIASLREKPRRSSRSIKVGLINSNKNSAVKGSLYSLRRRTITRLSEAKLGFVYAGADWEQNLAQNLIQDLKELFIFFMSGLPLSFLDLRFRFFNLKLDNCLGFQQSSRRFLSGVEIALVIENERNYFSEKLTDALFARCQIVYVGPLIPRIASLRNVKMADPSEKSIEEAVKSLLKQNWCGIDYSAEELDILSGLRYDKANEVFIRELNNILLNRETD